jgi:tetratricopeptide (TPR) repeat protein
MKILNFRALILMFFFCSALFINGCGCGNNRHYIKARELYKNKDLAGAIEELKTAHKQQPKNVEILSFAGKVYLENKNYDEAVEMFEKELKIVPGDIQAHLNIARAYKEKGEGALAIKHFNKVIEINPKGKLATEAQKLIPECSNLNKSGGESGQQDSSTAQNKKRVY